MKFAAAASVFCDPLARIHLDEDHSDEEPREIVIGHSTARRLLLGSFTEADGLQTEYRFDYSKAKPNRFAANASPGSVAVLLDPAVAEVFKSAKTVNSVLRAHMSKPR